METIEEQEGVRPRSGEALAPNHYSDTTITRGALPHSPPKSPWRENSGASLSTNGAQYDPNSSMGSISEYQQLEGTDNVAEPRKIVVLGVPWQTEDATLLSHFSEFGTVEDAQIMRERYTGKSRGFGFVTFTTTAEAQHATTAEHVIDGRRCEAKFALPEGKVGSARTTRIFIARIPSSVSDIQFRGYFQQFGAVQDAYMPKDPSKQGHRGIGFVTYASPDSVEHVMTGTHVLNGNEVAIDRATPKERTQGAMLPGRLSMSQPNLHILSGVGGSAGAAHSGRGAFPAFMRGSGLVGGLGSGVFPPHSPSYYYGEASGHGGGGGAGLGSRQMSHPVLPSSTSHFGSPLRYGSGSGSGIAGRGSGSVGNLTATAGGSAGASYGSTSTSATTLQAALQQHLSSNSLSSLDGTVSTSATPHQQQLINLINANVTAAGTGVAATGNSDGQFPPRSGPSSSNDLTNMLPQQHLEQQMQHTHPAWMHPGVHSSRISPGNLQDSGAASGSSSIPPAGPPSSRAGPRIFVGKLNRETSDQDVKDYFARFGYVLDVYLPRDRANKREHRGFGFVTFETEASIQRVVTHGPHYIRGSVSAIDSAVPRQDEMMVLTIDTPAVQPYPNHQHMQYLHHQQQQQQQYYPSGPLSPTQQYQQHVLGGGQHRPTPPVPVPGPGLSEGGGAGGGGHEPQASIKSNPAAPETLQAFEGLSLGQGSAGGAGNTGGSLSAI